MMTAPICSSTSGSEPSAVNACTQSPGRLKVGMPTARLGARSISGSRAAYQPADSNVTAVSVVMSNQIQPPSSNGPRSTSISTQRGVGSFARCVIPRRFAHLAWNSRPPTWMRDESAFER